MKKIFLILITIFLISGCVVENKLNGNTKEHCGEASYFDGYLEFYNDELKQTDKYNILVCSDSGQVVFIKQNDTSGDFYYFITEQKEHWTNYKLIKYEQSIITE